MRKPICRTDETLRRLETIVAKLKAEGEIFLPAERPLSEMLGTSRMTLRKAVDELEARGILEAGPRGRVISANAVPETKGRLLFIAGGVDWIVLPAWNRLWTRLEKLAQAMGWSCKLKLCGTSSEFDAAELEDSDFIVYSSVGKGFDRGFMEFAAGRDNVIGVQEEHAAFLKHVVTLDNFAAGRIAAKLLLDAGYKKPAMLRQENGYLGFLKRHEGFQTEVARQLPKYDLPCIVIPSPDIMSYVRGCLDRVEELRNSDVDSLFVVTDELIDLVYVPFANVRRIPEDFGLVTLTGSQASLVHQPPITAVGHGSSKVADAILELMARIKDGRQPDKPSLTLVEPGVHEGATVRSRRT